MTELSIIVPAYNAIGLLPGAIPTIQAYMKELSRTGLTSELIIIENGSTDGTSAYLKHNYSSHPAIRILTSEKGKGIAVKTGMLAAYGKWRYMCDVDLSTPIHQVSNFLATSNDTDIVIGNREIEGSIRKDEPDDRHQLGKVYNLMVQIWGLYGYTDTQCGFKLFRGDVADDLFSRSRIRGWAFDVEILYLAIRKGYTIKELGVLWTYNPDSKIRPMQDAWRMFWDLWKIKLFMALGAYGDLSYRKPAPEMAQVE